MPLANPVISEPPLEAEPEVGPWPPPPPPASPFRDTNEAADPFDVEELNKSWFDNGDEDKEGPPPEDPEVVRGCEDGVGGPAINPPFSEIRSSEQALGLG